MDSGILIKIVASISDEKVSDRIASSFSEKEDGFRLAEFEKSALPGDDCGEREAANFKPYPHSTTVDGHETKITPYKPKPWSQPKKIPAYHPPKQWSAPKMAGDIGDDERGEEQIKGLKAEVSEPMIDRISSWVSEGMK